tara:strand:- start:1473 stop:1805 length:333 start_codon:yes stop_codon:yes gene_type:complete
MDKGLEYDIKQASNSQLTPSAQKNYAENAQADVKSGINMMGQATMGDRVSPLNYSGNNIKLRSNINMMGDPNAMPVTDIEQGDAAGQSLGTEVMDTATMMKKGMDKATGY